MNYAHVKLFGQRAFWLEVERDDDTWLIGYEVNKEGSRLDPPAAFLEAHNAEFGQRKHLIMKAAEAVVYIKPAVMNLTYGWLEEAS